MKSYKPLIVWLSGICLLIYLNVLLGGITRLTGSGLSIVEWRPIMGWLPPFTAEDWNIVFEKYKQFPEFIKLKTSITMEQFQTIYYWEYFHRLLGRLIGVFYFFPLLFFTFQHPQLRLKLWLGFILGGLQGVLGWYMVKSGLSDIPYVSHYRLAAHLGLALFILCYLVWIILSVKKTNGLQQSFSPAKLKKKTWFLVYGMFFTLSLQIIYGAFVAGLKAGKHYNTFPLMNGKIIPAEVLEPPILLNFLETVGGVQFVHRTLAWLLLVFVVFISISFRKENILKIQKRWFYSFKGLFIIQFLLGVLSLLYYAPLTLSLIHQILGVAVLLSAMIFIHSLRFSEQTPS